MPVVPPPIVSPASNDNDFLASHLGALLLRQPSITTAPSASDAVAVASPGGAASSSPSVSPNVLLPAASDPVSITALRIAAEEEEKARRLARNHSRKQSTASAGPSSSALTRSTSSASSPECPSTPAPARKAHVRSLTSFNIALASSSSSSPSALTSPSKSTGGFYTRFGGPRRPSVEASYDALGLKRSSPSQCSDAGSVSGAAPPSPSLSRASSCGGIEEADDLAAPHGFGFGTAGALAGETISAASSSGGEAMKPTTSSMSWGSSVQRSTTMMTTRPKLTQRSSTSVSLTLSRKPKEERPVPRVMLLGGTDEDQETLVPVSQDGRTFRFVSGAPTSPRRATSSSTAAQPASLVDFGGYSLASPVHMSSAGTERAKEKARAMHAQRSASEGAARASSATDSRSSSVSSSGSGSGSDDASPAVSEGNLCPGLGSSHGSSPCGRTGSPSSSLPSGSSSSPDTPSDVRGPSPSNINDAPRSLKSARARETDPLDAQVRKEGLQTRPSLAHLAARA